MSGCYPAEVDVVCYGVPGTYKHLTDNGLQNSVEGRKPKDESPTQSPSNTNQPACIYNAVCYFRNFSDSVSVDGLKFLGEKGRTATERVFWTVTLTVAIVLSVCLVIQTYQKWISSPVIVTFATSQTPIFEIPFPAVTICPEIRWHAQPYKYEDLHFRKKKNKTLTSVEETVFQVMSLVCDTQPDLLDVNSTVTSHEEVEILRTLAPDFKDFVFGIQWRGREFGDNTAGLFSPVLTDDGVCYTFNLLDQAEMFTDVVYIQENTFSTKGLYSQLSPEKGYLEDANTDAYPRRSYFAGIQGGLTINLLVSSDDFDYVCDDSLQGFKVILHYPTAFPRVKQNYFRVPLDESVVAAITPNIMTSEDLRSYSPQERKCYFAAEKKLKFFRIYNQQNCLVECLANFILEQCGCVSFHLPREASTPICGATSKICQEEANLSFMTNEVSEQIKQGVKYRLTRKDLYSAATNYSNGCNCLPACNSVIFDAETSQSRWDWASVFRVWRQTSEWNEDIEKAVGNNKHHASHLAIFYKNVQFLTTERNELYGYVDFWANIGGIIGLFTGFSLVTLFEILYYIALRFSCNIKLFGCRIWSESPEVLEGAESKYEGNKDC